MKKMAILFAFSAFVVGCDKSTPTIQKAKDENQCWSAQTKKDVGNIFAGMVSDNANIIKNKEIKLEGFATKFFTVDESRSGSFTCEFIGTIRFTLPDKYKDLDQMYSFNVYKSESGYTAAIPETENAAIQHYLRDSNE